MTLDGMYIMPLLSQSNHSLQSFYHADFTSGCFCRNLGKKKTALRPHVIIYVCIKQILTLSVYQLMANKHTDCLHIYGHSSVFELLHTTLHFMSILKKRLKQHCKTMRAKLHVVERWSNRCLFSLYEIPQQWFYITVPKT